MLKLSKTKIPILIGHPTEEKHNIVKAYPPKNIQLFCISPFIGVHIVSTEQEVFAKIRKKHIDPEILKLSSLVNLYLFLKNSKGTLMIINNTIESFNETLNLMCHLLKNSSKVFDPFYYLRVLTSILISR